FGMSRRSSENVANCLQVLPRSNVTASPLENPPESFTPWTCIDCRTIFGLPATSPAGLGQPVTWAKSAPGPLFRQGLQATLVILASAALARCRWHSMKNPAQHIPFCQVLPPSPDDQRSLSCVPK